MARNQRLVQTPPQQFMRTKRTTRPWGQPTPVHTSDRSARAAEAGPELTDLEAEHALARDLEG
eukprot:3347996-Rhodomonas_salina.2